MKFKAEEEPEGFAKLKMPGSEAGSKPLIQEVDSTVSEPVAAESVSEAVPEKVKEEPFVWEKAEIVAPENMQFMHQKDLVFINFNVKGYLRSKEGIRYALSENELLVEIRTPGTNVV